MCLVGPGQPCPSSESSHVSGIDGCEVCSCVLKIHSESGVKWQGVCTGGRWVVHLGSRGEGSGVHLQRVCAGPEGWRSDLASPGACLLGLGAQGCLCKASTVSPLGGSTHFIFSWCICRLSSCPVSSGVPISCSRATWVGNGPEEDITVGRGRTLTSRIGAGETEAPRKAEQGGGGQAGRSLKGSGTFNAEGI